MVRRSRPAPGRADLRRSGRSRSTNSVSDLLDEEFVETEIVEQFIAEPPSSIPSNPQPPTAKRAKIGPAEQAPPTPTPRAAQPWAAGEETGERSHEQSADDAEPQSDADDFSLEVDFADPHDEPAADRSGEEESGDTQQPRAMRARSSLKGRAAVAGDEDADRASTAPRSGRIALPQVRTKPATRGAEVKLADPLRSTQPPARPTPNGHRTATRRRNRTTTTRTARGPMDRHSHPGIRRGTRP